MICRGCGEMAVLDLRVVGSHSFLPAQRIHRLHNSRHSEREPRSERSRAASTKKRPRSRIYDMSRERMRGLYNQVEWQHGPEVTLLGTVALNEHVFCQSHFKPRSANRSGGIKIILHRTQDKRLFLQPLGFRTFSLFYLSCLRTTHLLPGNRLHCGS